jgi:high-affinity Fe2+/Pb2+ permease
LSHDVLDAFVWGRPLYLDGLDDKTNKNRFVLMSSAFIQAAVILLREGLEAMLVIAALAAI